MKKVLVFPCGSEIGLEIYRALCFSKDFELVGASSYDDHGSYVYENYISGVPFVDDDGFVDYINKIAEENDIDFIFPAHDSVVLKLAQNISSISAVVVTSPEEVCEVSRSKRKTYEVLRDSVNVPHEYNNLDGIEFPVFMKPDIGQGSKGTYLATSTEDITFYKNKDPSLMVLQYLPGEEYTIDCFTNRHGELVFSQARIRARISNGISVNTKLAEGDEFYEMAKKINQQLPFRGVWFFQLKRDKNGILTLLEIAPRVAGTMAFSRMTGVNLPLLSLYDMMGIEVQPLINNFRVELDRALHAKFKLDISFNKVYVDFDDTILLEAKLNYLLIGLLYKFIEEGKTLILITKHLHKIEDTLEKHKISESIFSQIISLNKEDNKSDHILANSIFIDDSFAERKEVFTRCNIPVFDISEAVELI